MVRAVKALVFYKKQKSKLMNSNAESIIRDGNVEKAFVFIGVDIAFL